MMVFPTTPGGGRAYFVSAFDDKAISNLDRSHRTNGCELLVLLAPFQGLCREISMIFGCFDFFASRWSSSLICLIVFESLFMLHSIWTRFGVQLQWSGAIFDTQKLASTFSWFFLMSLDMFFALFLDLFSTRCWHVVYMCQNSNKYNSRLIFLKCKVWSVTFRWCLFVSDKDV